MSRFATDLLRVLASCYIVFNHVSWPVFMGMGTARETTHAWWTALANQFGKPSVLFFIFLSGFAFSGLAGERRLSTGRFYINRVARILPPFLAVTVLAFALRGKLDPLTILQSLPLGTGMFHLYFVPLICYLYLLFPLLRKIPATTWNVALFFGTALALYGALQLFRLEGGREAVLEYCAASGTGLCAIPGIQNEKTISAVLVWTRYFVFAVPFFQAGIWLGLPTSRATLEHIRVTRSRKKIALWLVPVVLLTYAGVFFVFLRDVRAGSDADSAGIIWRLSVALYAFACILTVSLLLRKGFHPLLSWLARCSFLVYLIHPFFIPMFRPWYPLHAVWPILALSWATAALLQWLALKNRALGFFLGEGDRLFAPLAGTPRTQSPPSNIP